MARLVRWLALQEKELDYINASRTLGSNPIKIIFSQMMPNLVGMAACNIEDLCAHNIGEALLRAGDARQRQAEYITKGGNSGCYLLIRYYYKNVVNIMKK